MRLARLRIVVSNQPQCGNRTGGVNPVASVMPEITQQVPQTLQKYVRMTVPRSESKKLGHSRNLREYRAHRDWPRDHSRPYDASLLARHIKAIPNSKASIP